MAQPFANFSYAHYRYKDFKFQKLVNGEIKTEDFSNKAVAGVAPICFNAGVDVLSKPGIYMNASYSYKDSEPITSNGEYKTSSFILLNAKLRYRSVLLEHINMDVFAGVNNITGTQHHYMVFVNQLPDAYIPAPLHAIYFGGINVNYVF